MNQIRVQTDFPEAAELKDRKIKDAVANAAFVNDIEMAFGRRKPLTMLDFGCLKGALVQEFTNRGHFAVGLEGKNPSSGLWSSQYEKLLFTADLSQKLTVLKDEEPIQCDFITGFAMADKIPPQRLPLFFDNVRRHLKKGGVFIGSIPMDDCFPQNQKIQLWEHNKLRYINGLSFKEYPLNHIAYPAFTTFYYLLIRTL
ncbi:MAG: methyltransferase domain-containing protein [Verrucomicrobia bacterium]|nr:methyltransferase domain-containing protein [Verrucomicrobiota bacterium]